ncbi:MAG TPA: S41 family peptidase [Terriglobales bacterium]|nr:S41 family peptidase [Terriglobales bacterium]
MSKKIKAVVLSVSVLLVLFAVIGGLNVRAASNDGAYRQLGVYSEVLSRIRSEYVEEPNIPQVTDGALHGLLESLDPNSSYLTPDEYKQYKDHKTSAKGNIGVAMSKRFGYAAVISVLPGSPADKAGVEGTDIVEAINGKTTRDMSLAEIDDLLAGDPGSKIELSLVRARRAEPLKLTVIRGMVTVPPVSDKLMDDGIGYIKVDQFNKGKAQEIAAKIKDLTGKGAKRFILDLRDCADGDEDEGIATANLFLDHGTITYLQGQRYPRQTFTADSSKSVTNLPLVVIVNRDTAGAAEIVAAAILQNNRGDVLGDKTFGVGSVQKVIEIPDGSALILSVAKYYSPNGDAIQDKQVTPNILVADNTDDSAVPDEDDNAAPPTDEELKKQQRPLQDDDQLQRAIQVLKNRKA